MSKAKVGTLKRVSELQGREYQLIQQDSEVEDVLDAIGISDEDGNYLYLLVKLDGSGADYAEVWGMYSAALSTTAELIHVGG